MDDLRKQIPKWKLKRKKKERDTYIYIYISKFMQGGLPVAFTRRDLCFLKTKKKKKKAISELENTVIKLEAKSFFKKCWISSRDGSRVFIVFGFGDIKETKVNLHMKWHKTMLHEIQRQHST